MQSGQQAALAHDLLELIDALDLDAPIVTGYDWGGRAACLVSALWPDRVAGLVTVSGYNVQDIAGATAPEPPEIERTLWYQYYLHGERGEAGLRAHQPRIAVPTIVLDGRDDGLGPPLQRAALQSLAGQIPFAVIGCTSAD